MSASLSDGRGQRHRSGDVVEVDDDQAKTWIGLGLAQPADQEAAPRTETRRAPRRATARREPDDDE